MSKVCPTCFATFADSHAFCPADGTTLRANDLASGFVGTVIADRYVIIELLGEGGMGKVYLAQHVKLPRQAAIKVLHAHMVQDPAAMARFSREASNASRIDHERVARVFDFGETSDGLVYLAMEYITGRDLKQILAEEGPLPLPRAAAIIRQVADGLDAAHKLGIVHRDLKPDNIVVSRADDGSDSCKVVDFGIAKAVGSGEKSLTQTGFVIGTPEYMSPEQLMGEEIDHRSDVYALALMAYQCVAGVTPFDSNTPDRGMMARLTNQPRALTEIRPDQKWPAELQEVLNKGLERQRDKRFDSAGAFATAFEKALASPVSLQVKSAPPVAPPIRTPAPQVRQISTPPKATPRKPVAIPTAPRPPKVATPQPQPVSRPVSKPVRARRRLRLPQIPIVRWLTTAAVLGFAWLLLTEGSVGRALRRATGIARLFESRAKRMASSATDVVGEASTTVGKATTALTDKVALPTASDAATPPAAATSPAASPPASTREALDSLAAVLDASGTDAAVAGTVLSKLESLLPKAASAGDSTWTYIRIGKAHHLMGQNPSACTAIGAAKKLATSDAQREAIRAGETKFECPP